MPVHGLALLEGELYVLHDTGTVHVYNTTTYTESRRFELPPAPTPPEDNYYIDMASSIPDRCIYILLYSPGQVYRVDPYGNITMTWTVGYDGQGVSVTPEQNVLVAAATSGKIILFTPGGHWLNETLLNQQHYLERAIQLSSGRFVVCSSTKVFVAENNGTIVYSRPHRDGLSHLVVDSDGFALVPDTKGNQVLVLSSDLRNVRNLALTRTRISKPFRLLLGVNNTLFLGNNDPYSVIVFDHCRW